MIKPDPDTRNVTVTVYVDVPFHATLQRIETAIQAAINDDHCELEMRVTDIEAVNNPLSE
jgi:hypothetical protein